MFLLYSKWGQNSNQVFVTTSTCKNTMFKNQFFSQSAHFVLKLQSKHQSSSFNGFHKREFFRSLNKVFAHCFGVIAKFSFSNTCKTAREALQARWFPPKVVPNSPYLALMTGWTRIPPTGKPFPMPLAILIIWGLMLYF